MKVHMQADMQHRFAVDEDIANDTEEKLQALTTAKQRGFHITQCCMGYLCRGHVHMQSYYYYTEIVNHS